MLGQKGREGVYGDMAGGREPQLVEMNMNELKEKDVREWKAEETEAVVFLLLEQIRPLMSVRDWV